MVTAGKEYLGTIKRFDMPGFRPCAPYLREMKHYGILPSNLRDDEPVDPYQLDRRYWQSLWYRPPVLPASEPSRPADRQGPAGPMMRGPMSPRRMAP